MFTGKLNKTSQTPKLCLPIILQSTTPPPDQPLFSWRHSNGLRALTRTEFLKRINLAASELGLANLKGHGIPIRSTLEYLLRGVPFEVVKSIGCWTSEAFLLYLWQHAVIIAPYIQGTPIMDTFTRYTMPPLRLRWSSICKLFFSPSPTLGVSNFHSSCCRAP